MTEFPKYSATARKGDAGLRLVDAVVSNDFGWLFKRTHQEHDFGVDAHAEIVTPDGKVTGQSVAFQIKHGRSFFQEKNRWGYIYRGERKHFNYLANYPTPVLIVICDEVSGTCYWAHFDPSATSTTGKGWKLTVPVENKLSGQKSRVLELLPPAIDAAEAMEQYWAVNNLVGDSDYVHFIIDRPEVEALDTTRAREFFDRLRASKELAAHCQGTVEISLYGYDDDHRELFEIPQVRTYMTVLFSKLPEAFFFLRTGDRAFSLKAFAMCMSGTKIVERFAGPNGEHHVEYDTKIFVSKFLEPGFYGLNELTNWLGYSGDENKEICEKLMSMFGAELASNEG
ncbi:MAG TPA: DUF4365 and DUF1817 domain-containing protein [Rhodanobacteraceae bacterium]|nr:DUF4365 and DUF1817 domain-containing protein [Rhodanobacteraceae bacterium]